MEMRASRIEFGDLSFSLDVFSETTSTIIYCIFNGQMAISFLPTKGSGNCHCRVKTAASWQRWQHVFGHTSCLRTLGLT